MVIQTEEVVSFAIRTSAEKEGNGTIADTEKLSDSIPNDSNCSIYAAIDCNSTYLNQSLTCVDLYCFREKPAVATRKDFVNNIKRNKYIKGCSNNSLVANDGVISDVNSSNTIDSENIRKHKFTNHKPIPKLRSRVTRRQSQLFKNQIPKFTQSDFELESRRKSIHQISLVEVIQLRVLQSSPNMRNCYELQANPSMERRFMGKPSTISLQLESLDSRKERECDDFYDGFLNNPSVYTELLGPEPDESVLAGLQTVVKMVHKDQSRKYHKQQFPYVIRSRSQSPERFYNRNVILAPGQSDKSNDNVMDPRHMSSSDYTNPVNYPTMSEMHGEGLNSLGNYIPTVKHCNEHQFAKPPNLVTPETSESNPISNPSYNEDDLSVLFQKSVMVDESLPRLNCSNHNDAEFNLRNEIEVYTANKKRFKKSKSSTNNSFIKVPRRTKKKRHESIASSCSNSIYDDNTTYTISNEPSTKRHTARSISNNDYTFSTVSSDDVSLYYQDNSIDNGGYCCKPTSNVICDKTNCTACEPETPDAYIIRDSFDSYEYGPIPDNLQTSNNSSESSTDSPVKQCRRTKNLTKQTFRTHACDACGDIRVKVSDKATNTPMPKKEKKDDCGEDLKCLNILKPPVKPVKPVIQQPPCQQSQPCLPDTPCQLPLGGSPVVPCVCGGPAKHVAPSLLPCSSSTACPADNIPCETRYAQTVVSLYPDYTIYEVMKSSLKKPHIMSKVTEGIFVVKKA